MLDGTTYAVETSRLETDRLHIRRGRVRSGHFGVRLYTIPELRTHLYDVGFTSVRFTDRDGGPLDIDSRRLVAVAR